MDLIAILAVTKLHDEVVVTTCGVLAREDVLLSFSRLASVNDIVQGRGGILAKRVSANLVGLLTKQASLCLPARTSFCANAKAKRGCTQTIEQKIVRVRSRNTRLIRTRVERVDEGENIRSLRTLPLLLCSEPTKENTVPETYHNGCCSRVARRGGGQRRQHRHEADSRNSEFDHDEAYG
jgi:hypothetical protein